MAQTCDLPNATPQELDALPDDTVVCAEGIERPADAGRHLLAHARILRGEPTPEGTAEMDRQLDEMLRGQQFMEQWQLQREVQEAECEPWAAAIGA